MKRLKTIVLFSIGLFIFMLLLKVAESYLNPVMENLGKPAPTINSEEDLKRFAVGTWTYTEPIKAGQMFPWGWVKWVIHDDGTMMVYYAQPNADDWGEGELLTYEIISDKFQDTGKRWYGVKQKGSMLVAIYQNNHLYLRKLDRQDAGKMVKGDINPFSK